ncbi:hypothetical protein HispidOSU_016826 [Sigmodon hispidus]
MAKAAVTAGNLPLLLSLFFPLSCPGSSLPADAASLCYSFTVGKAESGPWRQEVQGQLNEQNFLSYNSNKGHVSGVRGIRLNATKIWETQADTLKDGLDLLKAEVVHMRQENGAVTGPLTLEARVCCWHEVDGRFNGSWDFDLNGHKMLHIDSSTGKWTEVDPGSSWLKGMWRKNRDLMGFLNRTSQGDCRSWLEEFKSHREEKLEPPASPSAASVWNQASFRTIKYNNISVLVIILPYSLLLWILRIFDNDRLNMLQRRS